MTAGRGRLHFIDFARSYAVLLALLSHAMVTSEAFARLGESSFFVQVFTRTATPMFVFMFGFMLEFVYATRAREQGLEAVRRRLLVRSFQCYCGYALTSLCAVLGGYKSAYTFLSSLLFFGNSRFGNILRVYAVVFLLAPLLIRLRLRYGVAFLAVLLLGVAASFPVLLELQALDFGPLNNPLSVLLGIGPGKRGPSVWHSLSFALAGMLLASSLTRPGARPEEGFARFYLYALGLIAACAAAWVVSLPDAPAAALTKFADLTYRRGNMPGYFVVGVLASVVTLTIFCRVIGTAELPRAARLLLPLGLSSLVAYTAGNVLLNLFGSLAPRVHPALFVSAVLLATLTITRHIERLPFYGIVNDLLHLRPPVFVRAAVAGVEPRPGDSP